MSNSNINTSGWFENQKIWGLTLIPLRYNFFSTCQNPTISQNPKFLVEGYCHATEG